MPENPRAFPELVSGRSSPSGYSGTQDLDFHCAGGMTLRDYFAARLVAIIVNRRAVFPSSMDWAEFDVEEATWMAQMAYRYADAMLKAREEQA